MDTADRVISRLDEVAEWLTEQIDGGDECRGRDQEISAYIRYVEGAAAILRAYSNYVAQVDAAVAKAKEMR